VEQKLRETHEKYMKKVFKECEIDEAVGRIPVAFNEPVYGTNHINFSQFMAPGVVIT